MNGRKPEEIKKAIIEAIKNGNRSGNDIKISAKVGDYDRLKKFMKILIDEGTVKVGAPSIFDHGHVKKVYLINDGVIVD